MERKKYIKKLKEYRQYLVCLKYYQMQHEETKYMQEEKPKVLVLRKKFYGKDLIVK